MLNFLNTNWNSKIFEKWELGSLESDEMWDMPSSFCSVGIHGVSTVPIEPDRMYEQGFVNIHICRRYIMHLMKAMESRTLLYASPSLSAGS